MAIEYPASFHVPPIVFTQTKFPDASNLEIKISENPFEVTGNIPGPGSKSTVPLKAPVMYTLLRASVVIEWPYSYELPISTFTSPSRFAHRKSKDWEKAETDKARKSGNTDFFMKPLARFILVKRRYSLYLIL